MTRPGVGNPGRDLHDRGPTDAHGGGSSCRIRWRYRPAVDSRPCYVLDGTERYPGMVLAWIKDPNGWHAVVRYSRMMEGGWLGQYEHAVPADHLVPRNIALSDS